LKLKKIFFLKRGLRYFEEENLKGDEEQEDLTRYKELSQALLMNLALSNFKVYIILN
jgi:hypothetical protein